MTEKNDDTFRVIDRRLFTAEGELREEVAEQQRREEKAATTAKTQPASKTAPKDSPTAARPTETPKRMPGFEMLIDLVARNAVALMGGMTDPRTGQPLLDLEGAREVIDMLDALQEKTRGNLAPEEEQALLEVIGSLKMSYLEMSKAAAAAFRGKAQGKS